MRKKDKDFIRDNYIFAAETKSENGVPIEVYRARCIKDLPKVLIRHIASWVPATIDAYRVERHNADYGYFDAVYVLEVKVKGGFPSKAAAYVSAILRRPFTTLQQKHYEEICQQKDRLHHIWDSVWEQ